MFVEISCLKFCSMILKTKSNQNNKSTTHFDSESETKLVYLKCLNFVTQDFGIERYIMILVSNKHLKNI